MSVEITAKPYMRPAPMSSQLTPPAKPPFPMAKNRPFQSVGKKSPNVKEDEADEVTLIWTAQKGGRFVAFVG